MTVVEPPTEVIVGLRFRTLVGDGKPLFGAVEKVGTLRDVDYWECRGLDGDAEDEIHTFPETTILGALRLASIFGGYDPDSDVFRPIDLDDRVEKLL